MTAKKEIRATLVVSFDVEEEASADYTMATLVGAISGSLRELTQEIERQLVVYSNVDATVRAKLEPLS